MAEPPTQGFYDTIIIGSGFGGTMAAHPLVQTGERVLMLERGDWVPRGPHNWDPDGVFVLTPFYTRESAYRVAAGGYGKLEGACTCVGGPSVFYGGASLRYREQDFHADPEILANSGAEWPVRYADLEPYYTQAEQLMGVAGAAGRDPTEPFRSANYPQPPPPLSPAARMMEEAALRLGLKPFPLPLAINFGSREGRGTCATCITCDAFACAVGAKNDLATCVIPDLIQQGLELRTNTVAVRLMLDGERVAAVACIDKTTGEQVVYRAKRFVLAAGALATPHLLLASGLQRREPGGGVIGHYLMRHCNAMVFGAFRHRPDPDRRFHKQLAIHDFYFGDPGARAPRGKLGNIQQVMTPPVGLIQALLPRPLGRMLAPLVDHLTGLLAIAEDQPRYENRVVIDESRTDRFGLPQLVITHRYTRRDRAARAALVRRAKQILREAGALFSVVYPMRTFSHVLGTVRMGVDAQTSALDAECRLRGVENLHAVDASCLPTSAGVNPSLTIAANALRVGNLLSRSAPTRSAAGALQR